MPTSDNSTSTMLPRPCRSGSAGSVSGGTATEFALQNPRAIIINTEGAAIDDEPLDEEIAPYGLRSPGGGNHATTRVEPRIYLPNHEKAISHISLDIGGSLCKVVFFRKSRRHRGGRLHFEHFPTANLPEYISSLKGLLVRHRAVKILATGGGAYKFEDLIRQQLGVKLEHVDEMECLINGAIFFAKRIPNEVFVYSEQEEDPIRSIEAPHKFPWLLVNIGSGVSMLKINGPGEFERIGGSSLGGGTLWGLLSMITPATSFDDMLKIAENGDNRNVDMLVGDIYGQDYSKIGLKASTIASSFGKVFKEKEKSQIDPADISRSLLYAVSNNIGQLAYLHARYHGIEHIFFGGSYIRGHPQTIHTLAYAIKFWSQGEKTAYFFRHEGYLGAVGAFIDRGGEILEPGNESPSPSGSGSDSHSE